MMHVGRLGGRCHLIMVRVVLEPRNRPRTTRFDLERFQVKKTVEPFANED